MPLVVTGSVGFDSIEVPSGEKREHVLGGSCTYFSAAASFHGPVRIVAVVGKDFTDEQRAVLAHFGVDTKGLEARDGKTFRWGGRYHANMDERDTLYTELNVLGGEPPRVPEEYKDADVVFLANNPPRVQLDFLEQFPHKRFVVADTMDLWITTARAELEQLLTRIDGLVLNYDEAELLSGKQNTVAAARDILEKGPRFVVVKKGEHGCLFVHREGIGALPAYPSERVVDPTGAGDSFAGGMMGFLASHDVDDLGRFDAVYAALVHGTIIASFTIEDFGLGRLQTLKRQELLERLEAFVKMLRVPGL
ncbi:sugar kinase [Candidatus Woesearchaeota archaeon]|nr:MAG: sugar kinase [Candidatus Woesearchaeota archaeon]